MQLSLGIYHKKYRDYQKPYAYVQKLTINLTVLVPLLIFSEQPGWRFDDNIQLKLPKNVIKGSERAQFSIIGLFVDCLYFKLYFELNIYPLTFARRHTTTCSLHLSGHVFVSCGYGSLVMIHSLNGRQILI